VTIVPKELLESLARSVPVEPEVRVTRRGNVNGTVDLEQWILEHSLDVAGPSDWKGGRRWVFSKCPWNSDHRQSAFIVQFSNGAIAAGCHHHSCNSKNWRSLRDLFEPSLQQNEANVIEFPAASSRNCTGRADDPGLIKEIADSIVAQEHFARDGAGRVHIYSSGVYHARGEFFIKRKVKHWLEGRNKSEYWERKLGEEVVEYIRLDTPELLIGHEPPCDVLNLKNGLLDIQTGVLRPHTPEFLYPVQIPIDYDPTAASPDIDRFLSEVFPEDAQALAWEILGDSLTPDRSIQKAILLMGEGGNGKGVFLALYINFLGRRNVSTVPLHKLEADRFSVARLYGRLANVCADLPSAHLAGTSVFKSVTGNDTITGEFKFRDSFDFEPFCRLLFSANHPPRSKDASKAFYDRWLVIPFNRSFRNTEQEIPRSILDARLAAPRELSGALNKAITALRQLRASGRFTESETTRAALAEFREVTDPVAVWLDRQTVSHANASISKRDLQTAYNLACEHDGRPPMTKQAFGRAVKKHRPDIEEAQRTVGLGLQWFYVGLGLKAETLQSGSLDSRDSLDLSIPVSPVNGRDV
jgi:putative DNA primase/helicase